MGWGGGNEIVSRVAKVAEKRAAGAPRDSAMYTLAQFMLAELVDACRDHDADNLYELEGEGPILDLVLYEAGVLGEDEED